MRRLFLLFLIVCFGNVASAQNEVMESNSAKALPLVNQAAANAMNIKMEPMFDDSLGLFGSISDSTYCEKVNGWMYPYDTPDFLGISYILIRNMEFRHWNLGQLRFSAAYNDGELVFITSGCFLGIGHQECSSLNYFFYGNELIHTSSSCIAYIGAICSGEHSRNFYTWRNNEIICKGGNGRVLGEEFDFYISRCHCAEDLSREQWLDSLTEILFYMYHLKPNKVEKR